MTLFSGIFFLVNFPRPSKSHFCRPCLLFCINFGGILGPFGLFLDIMHFEAPLTRKPYFYRFGGPSYLICSIVISEHGCSNTFITFSVILLIFPGCHLSPIWILGVSLSVHLDTFEVAAPLVVACWAKVVPKLPNLIKKWSSRLAQYP